MGRTPPQGLPRRRREPGTAHLHDRSGCFLDSLVSPQPDAARVGLPPDSEFFDPHQDEDHDLEIMERTLHEIASSLAHSPPPASPSALADAQLPSRQPSPKGSPLPTVSSSSQLPSRSKPPLILCLPSRPARLAPDDRYSSTPYNTPTGRSPSTPASILPSSATIPDSLPSSRTRKPAPSTSSSLKRKKVSAGGVSERPSLPPASLKDVSGVSRGVATPPSGQSSSNLPLPALLAEDTERFERELEESIQHSGTLQGAIELQRLAQSHVAHLKRMKDALAEELVRVQIEESVLRHVRGIISERQSSYQQWENNV